MLGESQEISLQEVDEKALHAILEVISDGVWDWNANTGFVYRNPGWYTMLGYSPHTLGNTVFTWEKVIHPEDLERVMAHFDAYINGLSEHYCIEYRCRTQSGDYIWIEDRGRIVARNGDGSVARMIGAHRDIHARKLLLERLESRNVSLERLVEERTAELIQLNAELKAQVELNRQLAETDCLTRAFNRHGMEKALKRECERAKRFNHPLSLVIMDVDDFKAINDRYGHAAGDRALVQLVALVQQHVREIDLIARWGGDEFMIILPSTPLHSARVVAEKIQELMLYHPLLEEEPVTLSVGLAEYRRHDTPQELTVRADRALYRAKSSGKNLICH